MVKAVVSSGMHRGCTDDFTSATSAMTDAKSSPVVRNIRTNLELTQGKTVDSVPKVKVLKTKS